MQKTKLPVERFARPLRAAIAGAALLASGPLLTGCVSDVISSCAPEPPRKKKIEKKTDGDLAAAILFIAALAWLAKKLEKY